jgi:hypothetical protein
LEQLRDTIYEFICEEPVSLARISGRQNHSLTTAADGQLSNAFRAQLIARDQKCVVSDIPGNSLIASHLIPKRMGLLNTSAIVTRYAGPGFSQVIMNVFHPMLGVLLFSALDTEVDAYSVGFYRDPNDEMVSFISYLPLVFE